MIYQAQLQKVGHREDAHIPFQLGRSISRGFRIFGIFRETPQAEDMFWFESPLDNDNWFRTSVVKSVYIHESTNGQDRLVLPTEFPKADMGDLPQELKAGDILFATMNSIYLLSEIIQIEETQPKGKGSCHL